MKIQKQIIECMRLRGWVSVSEYNCERTRLLREAENARSEREQFARYAAGQIERAMHAQSGYRASEIERVPIWERSQFGAPAVMVEHVIDRTERYRVTIEFTYDDLKFGFAAGDERTLQYFCELQARRIFAQLRYDMDTFRKVRA